MRPDRAVRRETLRVAAGVFALVAVLFWRRVTGLARP